jgi:hypothetical protein
MRGRTVLAVLAVLSFVVGAYEATSVRFGYGVGPAFQLSWSFVFIVLVAIWVDVDSREHRSTYRPFEFGFLVFYFWLPYIPYYLLRTRRLRGALGLLGLLGLFNLGYLFELMAHAAR